MEQSKNKVTYHFNGVEYTMKNRFCQAVVRYYADQHPEAKLEDLQKVFDINKKVPMVASREQALAILDYEGKAGGDFFLGEGDDIDVRGGKVFVWKYFPKTYFDPFMVKVKELGYEFEVVGESEATQSETANTEKKKKTVTITINSPKVGNLYRFFDCSDEKYVDLFDDDADAEEVIDALWDNDAEPFAEDVIVYLSDDEEVNVRVEDEDGEELFDGEVSPVNEFCADPRQLDTSLLPKDVKKIIDEDIQNELNNWESEDFEEYENEHRDEEGQVDWSEFECSSISPGIVTDIIMSRKCNACAGKLIFTDTSTIYGASYDGVIELDEDEEFDIDKLELYITDHDVTTCWEDCVSPMVKYGNKFYLFDIGAWDRDEAEGEWKDLRDE